MFCESCAFHPIEILDLILFLFLHTPGDTLSTIHSTLLMLWLSSLGIISSATDQLLRGIIRGLGICGQRRQPEEVAFYVTILNMAGPLVHDFCSLNLNGPSLSKTRKDREAWAWFRLSTLEDNVCNVGQVLVCCRTCVAVPGCSAEFSIALL